VGTLLIYRYSLWSISWRTRRSRDFAALYIGWSTQNHCTGRTQCTALWSKIVKICPKSQFLSKFLSESPKFPFYIFSLLEYNTILCWNILVKTKSLHGLHPVHCTVSQNHQNLSKKYNFSKIPQIFIFNLISRFEYNSSLCWNQLVAQHKLLHSAWSKSFRICPKRVNLGLSIPKFPYFLFGYLVYWIFFLLFK